MASEVMTLQEVADALGVHYMTAYRYVRLGLLDARKVGGGWRVTREDFVAFAAERADERPSRQRPARWDDRLESRLLAGDTTGAWNVVEAAMTAGMEVGTVYVDVLAPAMRSIGRRWEVGEIDIAVEHRASGIASRLVGRLGSYCTRPGRSRGTILLGAPVGERHSLPVAILADLLRLEGWEVSDLGADTPVSSFVLAASEIDDLAAVGLSVTHADHLDACMATCEALRVAKIDAPVVLGGQAVRDLDHARSLGATAYAPDAAGMLQALDGLSGSAA